MKGVVGRPAKVLMREDIERAMRVTLSNRAAARYLHVSYPLYRQYAKLFKDENGITLFEKHKNPSGKGIPKFATSFTSTGKKSRFHKKEPPIADILAGRVSAAHFNPQQLKYKLISLGLLEPKCSRCGYDKARILDGRSPLILQHKDGNSNNWNLDNLEFVCYNCAFLEGPNSAVTDKMVINAEDGVERNGAKLDETYELDDYQKQFLNGLFNDEPKERPGEEYISRF